MARFEVREFTAESLDEAARLLAERHRQQRRQIFALDRKFETPVATREQVAALLAHDTGSPNVDGARLPPQLPPSESRDRLAVELPNQAVASATDAD